MQWLWLDAANQNTTLAQELRDTLLEAETHGLGPADYWTPALEKQFTASRRDPETFERAMTATMMKYATDLSVGRVNPGDVADEVRIGRATLKVDRITTALRDGWNLHEALDSLAPKWPAYGRLKTALARLKAMNPQTDFPDIPKPKKGPRLGESSDLVARIKMRLYMLGYDLKEVGPLYNQELLEILRRYFTDNTLPGEVNLTTNSPVWLHLGTSLPERIQQVKMTMEKLRWVPLDPNSRYIDINLALQKLRIYENGQLVMEMRTINGRPKRRSPTLKDRVTVVELNPAWVVPDKLIIEDKVPAILKDPKYLDDHHYRVFDRNGRPLQAWQVDWAGLNYDSVKDIMLRQEPGLGNALGVLKLHLDNPYAIYMHDTNERWLFGEQNRLLSSGCIRLERPLDVAMYLLRDHPKWSDRAAVEAKLATTPVAAPGVDRMFQIPLKQAVPVYTNYLTAEADEAGLLKFAGDYYEQDTALYNTLKNGGYKNPAEAVETDAPVTAFDLHNDGP